MDASKIHSQINEIKKWGESSKQKEVELVLEEVLKEKRKQHSKAQKKGKSSKVKRLLVEENSLIWKDWVKKTQKSQKKM